MLHDFSCNRCPLREQCVTPCAAVESILPAVDRGELHALRREEAYHAAWLIVHGQRVTRAMLENRHRLPAKMRRCFDLYYNDSLTHEQIAARLGVHRHTAMRNVHAAENYLLALARQDLRDGN
jgi:DNA-directed RNA polymerase specialized sigma24 family protein